MIKKFLTAGALFLTSSLNIMAQEICTPGQNYINRFSLAPAFAGFNGNTEGFMSYRNTMTGIDGAPVLMTANINGNLKDNMGFGANIVSEKAGNFNNVFAALTYAYHLKFSEDAALSLALSPAIIRSSYNLGNAKTVSANTDPLFQNQAGLSGTGFDAGFSAMFNMKSLYFSVYMPRLICQDLKFQNGIINSERMAMASISYGIETEKWEIEPAVDVAYAFESGLEWRGAVAAKYNKIAWLQLSYASQNWVGIGLGFSATNRVAFQYTYEVGTSDIAKSCNGSHEIALGFLISKGNNSKQPTIFYDEDRRESAKDKKDNKLEQELQKEIKKRTEEIKRLENIINGHHSGANSDNGASPTPNSNPINWEEHEKQEQAEIEKEWGEPFQLPNVKFGYGTANMFSSSQTAINSYAQQLIKNPGLKMLIVVYVDYLGSKSYSKDLANKRAEAIKKYLVSKGIAGTRIKAQGLIDPTNKLTIDPSQRYDSNRVEGRFKQ